MIILLFDTETTGLTDKKLPPHHPNQPDLVQMGAVLYDDEAQMVRGEINLIVQNDGLVVPENAAKVHGVCTETAARFGMPPMIVMAAFNNMAKAADAFVCHNAAYDLIIAKKAYHKLKKDHPFNDKPTICTMEALTDTIKLPPTDRMRAAGIHKYKAPSLMEAYKFVTGGKTFDMAHDAMADVRATLEVYKWLKEKGLV